MEAVWLKSIRCDLICKYIEERGFAKTGEICALFPELSAMTIHRDLDFLEEKGLIVRMRGGAKMASRSIEPRFDARELENSEPKHVIAAKAVGLVKPGMTVFIDAGTTMMALAKAFPDIQVNVFTTGPNIALELMKLKKPVISVCGGYLNRANLSLSGASTIDMLRKINIDLAFIGVSGFGIDNGFTGGRENEAAVKSLAISRAKMSVALMDKTKFKRVLPFTFAKLGDFSYVITNGTLSSDFMIAARNSGVVVL